MNDIINSAGKSESVKLSQDAHTLHKVLNMVSESKPSIHQTFDDIFYKCTKENINVLCQKIAQFFNESSVQSITYCINVQKIDGDSEKMNDDLFNIKTFENITLTASVTIEIKVWLNSYQTKQLVYQKITIHIPSSAAINKKNSTTSISNFIKEILDYKGAYAEIEYTDLIKSQSCMGIISDWFKSLDTIQIISPKIKSIQKKSHYISDIFSIIALASYSFLLYKNTMDFTNDLDSVTKFLIVAVPIGLLFYNISYRIGKYVERKIDSISGYTFIILNNKDNELLNKHQERKIKSIKDIFFTISIFILSNIILPILIEKFILN